MRGVGRSCWKFAVSSLVMGVLTYGFIRIPGLYAGSWAQRAASLAVAIVLAAGVYFGMARLLRARELREMGGIWSGRPAS